VYTFTFFFEGNDGGKGDIKLLKVSSSNKVPILLKIIGNRCLEEGLHLGELVLSESPDQVEVVVYESRSREVAQERCAALVDLREYKFEGLHLNKGDLFSLQNVGVARPADDPAVRGGLINNEHVGDFLRVFHAGKLDFCHRVYQPLPNIFVHNKYHKQE
jgi:hypothetical protein